MFYINAIPKAGDRRIATAGVFSVIRNASVPFGIGTEDQPNISSTRWRTVADHKSMIFHFESAVSPNVFWVDLGKLDFSPGADVRTLQLGENQTRILAGETSADFVKAEPFRFEGVK